MDNEKLEKELFEQITIYNEVIIEPTQRRKNRLYVREIIDAVLDKLPNHGILIIEKNYESEHKK